MIKKVIRFIYILLLVLCFGCGTSRVKSTICKSSWVIDSIFYKGESFKGDFFSLNMIRFSKDGECDLPDFPSVGDYVGKWKLDNDKGKYYINIYDSPDDVFNNQFEVKYKIEPQIINLELKSDILTMYCVRENW